MAPPLRTGGREGFIEIVSALEAQEELLSHRVTMRAMQLSDWGTLDNLKLVELPRPEPLPTEVLVRVKAAGVNPIDYHTNLGRGYTDALSLHWRR
jgi:hypothetical protein